MQQWFTSGPAAIVGVDIGSGLLKIAEIDWNNDHPVLKAVGMSPIPENVVRDGIIMDEAALAEIIRRSMASERVTGKHAVVSISGHAVFVRELTFPDMTTEELRQAIKWDLDKYIPAAESYYFDFAITGPGKEPHEIRVLLVAAPQTMIDAVVAITKEVGLKPLAIDIESLAVVRTLASTVNSLVVDIGDKMCQVNIFQNNCPVVSRSIPLGGVRYTEVIMRSLDIDFSEAERLKQRQRGLLQQESQTTELSYVHKQLKLVVEDLGREVRRTADYYKIQNKAAVIDNIILTGGGARLDNLAANLAEQFDGIAVLVNNPLTGLAVSKSLDREWLNGIAPQLAVAIGLALRGGDSN